MNFVLPLYLSVRDSFTLASTYIVVSHCGMSGIMRTLDCSLRQ